MRPFWLVAAVAVAAAAAHQRRRIGKVGVGLAAVVVVAAVLYGLGVYDLPKIDQVLLDIGEALGPWTYVLVATVAFFEAAAFLGLFVPGESGIIVGGVIAGQGQIELGWLIVVAVGFAYLGDVTGYWLGRRLGRDFLHDHGPRFGLREHHLDRVDDFFERHGGSAILIGRFVGVVRSLSPFVAGSARMPFARFAFWDFLGAGIQSAGFCVIGYVFWHQIDEVIEVVKSSALAVGVVIVLVVASILLVRRLRRG